MSKITTTVVSILSFLIAIAAGVSPEDTQSNLAAWAKFLGSEDMAHLFSPTVNSIVFWVAIAVFIVCLVTFFQAQIKFKLRRLFLTDKDRFHALAPDIEALIARLCAENEGVKALSETRMGVKTVTEAKLLIRELEKLKITAPGIRNIDRWIDWLPMLLILAKEKRLGDARKLGPHEPTLQQFTNIDERIPVGYKR